MKIKLIIAVLAILWVGMILAIGMESVVKFQTPTLIKSVGFDVGRTVFSAFNKVQVIVLIAIIICTFFAGLSSSNNCLIAIITFILLLQVFWLFPELSHRVDLILNNIKPNPTYKHGLYGFLEIAKLALLFILGIRLIT
jgi:hypothetical protein